MIFYLFFLPNLRIFTEIEEFIDLLVWINDFSEIGYFQMIYGYTNHQKGYFLVFLRVTREFY